MTNAVFVAMLEAGELEWPPFQQGNYIYSRGAESARKREIYRTAVPA